MRVPFAPTSLRVHSLVAVASLLLSAGCSAPPGTGVEADDDVPEFSGNLNVPGNAAANVPGNTASNASSNGNPTGAPSSSAGNTSTAPAAASSAAPAGAGGSTSAPSNEPTGDSNIGLTPPANDPASGQNSGAGGSSMVGSESGNGTSAAGSSSMPPASAPPPAAQNPAPQNPAPQNPAPQNPAPQNPAPQNPAPANPRPSGDCTGQFFCDGFESVADGASPTAALWTIIDGYAERPQSANVQVSADNAHEGGRALRVASTGGRTGVRAALPQTRYYIRAWFQIDSAPRGPVFIGLGTDQNSETRLRIQGESFATINTVGPGDAVHPDAANSGNCASCQKLTPNEWFCAEMFIDNATQSATLSIDGVEAATLANGQGGWPVQPASPKLFLGSMSVQGGQTGVWIDDVVAGPQRIGCD